MSTVSVERKQVPREEVPAGRVLCEFCTAKCCRYFALPIEKPESYPEWEYVRWFLMHGQATVFYDEGHWYLLVHTDCKHLRSDNMCGIYETRPQICRDYTTDECEYEEDWCYERYLETSEQVAEYMEAILPPRGSSIRSPQPPLLPILPIL